MGGNVGPDLARTERPRSLHDLAAAMWNHLPRMAARMREREIQRPHLGEREMGDLVAFLFTLNYFDPAGDIEAGRRLVERKRCITCHQIGGVGGVVGPNLDRLGRFGSPILAAAAMWNHSPAMADTMRARGIERPTFTGSELIDLLAYLESVAPEPAGGLVYVLPGRADRGRRLFTEKRCIQCHSVRGQGGHVGPDLADRALHRSLTQFAAAMWNKAPKMTRAMRERNISIPKLSGDEMADLVAYLYSVQYFAESGDPRRGRLHARQKGCLNCHALEGTGGTAAGDLARVTGFHSDAAVIAALYNHVEVIGAGKAVAWPALGAAEMADIIAFVRQMSSSR
jgi:cytochrome c2